jgi:predicted nucleic acid-binding protein
MIATIETWSGSIEYRTASEETRVGFAWRDAPPAEDETTIRTMALGSEADDLVTGDRRAGLLQRGCLGRTRIVTPATFCAEAL